MLPATLDLVVYRNVTFSLGINCLDANNNPVNITGWLPLSQVRDKPGGRLVVDLQPGISNPVTGSVLIALTAEQTESLDHGTYQWDFQMQKPDGTILGPFLAGKFLVNDSVTNTS